MLRKLGRGTMARGGGTASLTLTPSRSVDSVKSAKFFEDEGASAFEPQCPPPAALRVEATYGVHWQRYSLSTYLELPRLLRPFVHLPGLRNFLVVGRPTMDISGGLDGYRQAIPKATRRRAAFLVVVDRPGLAGERGCVPGDEKYSWVEFSLPPVFKLDLSGLSCFDDYVQRHLRRRHRRAFKVRQQELAGSPVVFEHVPLAGIDRPLVDLLWGLYLKNGQRHGFTVLSRRDFYRIHLGGTPGLSVLLARDSSRGGQIVTFSTGVRTGTHGRCDTLMSMWCGTDYDNPLSRSCSTYINSQYELIKIAIQDPEIRWLDLGAQLRQMKTGLGAQPHAVAGYLRCRRSKAARGLLRRMMQAYFNPTKLLTDP